MLSAERTRSAVAAMQRNANTKVKQIRSFERGAHSRSAGRGFLGLDSYLRGLSCLQKVFGGLISSSSVL